MANVIPNCLVPVWRLPVPSRSMYFGDVAENEEQSDTNSLANELEKTGYFDCNLAFLSIKIRRDYVSFSCPVPLENT